MPKEGDDRLNYRMAKLIPDSMMRQGRIHLAPARLVTEGQLVTNEVSTLQRLWEQALEQDSTHTQLINSIAQGQQFFPAELAIKVSVSDCSLDEKHRLRFRGRLWVPDYEQLRTTIVQQVHDSTLTGHPGKNGTIAMVSRDFFWPNMQQYIGQFVRNCDQCGRTKVWRDRKQGLLRPLPTPERQWQEVSMDFIGPLPLSKGYDMILVFVDRLGKGVLLEPCKSTTSAEDLARIFIRAVYSHHGPPAAMVSDRGPQFISQLWKRVCQLLRIERRISTAFHPQTDGQTERTNAEVEVLLRQWVNHEQDDWSDWLPAVQLALNGRDSTTTGVSPYLLSHGYPLQVLDDTMDAVTTVKARTPVQVADNIVTKLRDVTQWAQTSMSATQQVQEESANRHRNIAPSYKVGDKVWLNLRNVRTARASKKLDVRAAKYTVLEVVNPSSYRLDTPPGIHNVFNVDLLRPASTDKLPSQITDDWQPPAILMDGHEKWEIEKIIATRYKRLPGRSKRTRKEHKVKWTGYQAPTWEPASALANTEALQVYQNGGGR